MPKKKKEKKKENVSAAANAQAIKTWFTLQQTAQRQGQQVNPGGSLAAKDEIRDIFSLHQLEKQAGPPSRAISEISPGGQKHRLY